MSSSEPDQTASVPGDLATANERAAEAVAGARRTSGPSLDLPPVARWGTGYLALLFLAQFVMSIAQLAPSTYSLAVRVQAMAPADKNTMLALVLTIPAIAIILVNPIVGILSDRTRSRLGRRRPWMIGGLIAGLIGLTVIGVAPGIPLVIVGWTIGYLGLTAASSMVIIHFGDSLPENQRGKVSGINGAIVQIGPIAGILLSGALVHMPFMLFFVPGALALLGSIAFIVRMKDPSTRGASFERVSIGGIFARMVFNPRRHPDFGWVWISKAATFVALYLTSIYTVYFLGERLHLSQAAVAGLIAASGGIGILMTMVGALGSGFLSDKIRRRRLLVVIAGFVLAAGLVIIATTASPVQYIIGGLVFALGTGIFGAVDQALALDVLPDRITPGRFLAINALANEIPKAIAPVVAGLLVLLAGGQYQFVYIAAAVLALAGGLLVLPVKSVR
ncbi:MFS transporter [Rathayibacter sp. KR2-224]|uniref:MFS transporter n=1 Tax=Rathayibacter sp. KR2-224 TaxID=3400913 RepID=UPI003C08FDA4